MLKIGLMGAAGIAERSIVQPCALSDDAVLAAVAARRPGAAAAYAQTHGIPRHHDSYEALLDDPDIDAIYIALPPAMHAEWSIRALQAGKPVLCEKPIAMTTAEAREMFAVAADAGLILMEAFHDRYHPLTLHILDVLRSGRLGRIQYATASFLVDVPWDPKNIRFDPAQGGGAMMDLGCYPLHWLRTVFGSEPEVHEVRTVLTELGMDRRVEAEMTFDGVPATLTADLMDPPFRAVLRIEGAQGWIEVTNPCLPHNGHSVQERPGDGPVTVQTIAGRTTYQYQLAAFVAAVRKNTPPLTGAADAIGNMAALEAIYRKAGLR